jgi:4-nitrophenyl phosphatase
VTTQKLLTSIKALVIDMDGVLWRGDTALPGLQAFFQFVRRHDIPFTLATNNATKTPEQYLDKLAHLGVAVKEEDILTSAVASAAYLHQMLPAGARVHVVGEHGLRQALTNAGFDLGDQGRVEAVVAGLDTTITYEKLKIATRLIRGGARFVGTNPDRTLPLEDGIAPGAGAILAALEAATEVKPTIIGKPEPTMFKLALKRMGADAAQTAMIGDRLETDIWGGQRAGLATILVLSGVSTRAQTMASSIRPTWIFGGIEELTRVWQEALA